MALNTPMLSVRSILNDAPSPKKKYTFMHRMHQFFDLFGQCRFSFKKKKKPKIPGHYLHEYYMSYDNL